MTIIIDLTNWAHLAVIAVSLLILMALGFLAGNLDEDSSFGTFWIACVFVTCCFLLVCFGVLTYQAL